MAGALGSHGPAVTAGLAVACLVIAAGGAGPATTRPALLLSALVALAIWALGEDFGGLSHRPGGRLGALSRQRSAVSTSGQ